MKSKNVQTGPVGEAFVFGELLRRGFLAALLPEGMRDFDILCKNERQDRAWNIQVKTQSGGAGWMMGKKHERLTSKNLVYVFVDLGKTPEATPEYWVMPSEIVAQACTQNHKAYLDRPGRKGQRRRDGDLRRICFDYNYVYGEDPNPYQRGWMDPYHNRWDML